jgi:microcystin-dependent protein
MSRRKNVQMNKTLYYDNKINYHLSPHQGVVPELEEDIPAGCVMAYLASTSPSGWLICNGDAINRIDYWKLFAVIGTTFGSGDGSTTFNLPDYQGAFLRGTGSRGSYAGPNLNESQDHATQTHNHLATSTVTDPGHNHSTSDAYWSSDYHNSSGSYQGSSSNDDNNNALLTRTVTSSTSATGITVATTVDDSTTNVDPNETRPYNFGINWIIKY